MKKLSVAQKVRLRRHAELSLFSRLTRGRGGGQPRSNAGTRIVAGYSRGETRPVLLAAEPLPIPSVLCFDRNHDETTEFISSLAEKLCYTSTRLRRGFRVPPHKRDWHDFAQIQYISPSAALVLAAEYDRARIIAKRTGLITVNIDDWKLETRRTLEDLGFLNLLGIEERTQRPEGEKYVVQFKSEEKQNVDMKIASDTFKEVIRLASSAAILMVGDDLLANFRTVLLAIGEALINTSDHAYPTGQSTQLPSVGRWWITGAVDPGERRLTFTVYDQGVTIPRAIPHGRRFEKVRRFFRKFVGQEFDADDTTLDGRSIASAVRAGASATGLGHRGKGLGLMRSCIQRERTGRLRIVSRYGDYMACSGSKDQHRTRQAALHGTLIEWTVDL